MRPRRAPVLPRSRTARARRAAAGDAGATWRRRARSARNRRGSACCSFSGAGFSGEISAARRPRAGTRTGR
ncbi:peptidase inhibitor family I36 protein [Amycolatopsis sp. cg13]